MLLHASADEEIQRLATEVDLPRRDADVDPKIPAVRPPEIDTTVMDTLPVAGVLVRELGATLIGVTESPERTLKRGRPMRPLATVTEADEIEDSNPRGNLETKQESLAQTEASQIDDPARSREDTTREAVPIPMDPPNPLLDTIVTEREPVTGPLNRTAPDTRGVEKKKPDCTLTLFVLGRAAVTTSDPADVRRAVATEVVLQVT